MEDKQERPIFVYLCLQLEEPAVDVICELSALALGLNGPCAAKEEAEILLVVTHGLGLFPVRIKGAAWKEAQVEFFFVIGELAEGAVGSILGAGILVNAPAL